MTGGHCDLIGKAPQMIVLKELLIDELMELMDSFRSFPGGFYKYRSKPRLWRRR